MKMKICYDQGCSDIGVVIATKWRLYSLLFSIISRHWKLFQNRSRKLFAPRAASMFVSFSEICKSVIEIFWNEVFMVRNTVKNWQSWCSTVICTKRSAFDMQFHLIVVSIFLKTCVKDHGDSSSRLLERRIWLVCIEALLLAVVKTFWSTLTN